MGNSEIIIKYNAKDIAKELVKIVDLQITNNDIITLKDKTDLLDDIEFKAVKLLKNYRIIKFND